MGFAVDLGPIAKGCDELSDCLQTGWRKVRAKKDGKREELDRTGVNEDRVWIKGVRSKETDKGLKFRQRGMPSDRCVLIIASGDAHR